jgi:hypothetical protein
MAALNTETTEQQASAKKAPTHFINVSVVNKSGTTVKLGAIPVFENADKAQRTLLDFIAKGGDARNLDILIDVRENVKSTDTYDLNEWNIVDRVVQEAE